MNHRSRPISGSSVRAAWLTGLSPAHAEECQVVHYTPGQEYREHVDYFSSADARAAERMGAAGNRLISVFVYLVRARAPCLQLARI